VKSFGFPSKRNPDGAKEVVYGPERLLFEELESSKKTQPVMRYMTVPILDSKIRNPVGKAHRSVKKKLLNLKPWEYLSRSSDPKFGLRERAVLQSLKPRIAQVVQLKEESLKEIRTGSKANGLRSLHRVLQCINRWRGWTLCDHLMYRMVLWAIRELTRAKLVLGALGLTNLDLSDPFLRDHRGERSGGRRSVFFVNDGEYNTGVSS